MNIQNRNLMAVIAGTLGILLFSGFISFAERTGAENLRQQLSEQQRRDKALFELGCQQRDVVTWHQHKGYITNPKRTWVCDGQEIDDQLANILADERLKGGAKEWRQFRGQNEERRRLDTRP